MRLILCQDTLGRHTQEEASYACPVAERSSSMNSPTNRDSALARVLSEEEVSRKLFLKGGGALVLGLSTAGPARAGNNPAAASATHTGALPGPPNAALIDSWLQVNPNNSVTLYHGWAEMGQGSPTAVRMIAAEELGMSVVQGGPA